jgi:hypothetical protein
MKDQHSSLQPSPLASGQPRQSGIKPVIPLGPPITRPSDGRVRPMERTGREEIEVHGRADHRDSAGAVGGREGGLSCQTHRTGRSATRVRTTGQIVHRFVGATVPSTDADSGVSWISIGGARNLATVSRDRYIQFDNEGLLD